MLWLLLALLHVFFADCVATAAVEAMCTDAFLWKADTIDECLEFREFEACELELFTNGFDHAVVFGRICLCIFVEILACIAFKLFDHASGNELEVGLTACEVKERTAVNQWRA